MLKININEKATLDFEVELHGIDHNEVNGRLRFVSEKVEYGFPVEVKEEGISVEIPPLTEVIKNIESGQKLEAKLEIFGKGLYLKPWTEELITEPSVEVKVKLKKENKEEGKVKLVTKVNENVKPLRENSKRYINKEERIREQVSKKVKEKIKGMENLVDDLLAKQPTNVNKKTKVTEKAIFEFMSSAGLKNKQIQEVVLNKAKVVVSDSNNMKEVLSEVKKILQV